MLDALLGGHYHEFSCDLARAGSLCCDCFSRLLLSDEVLLLIFAVYAQTITSIVVSQYSVLAIVL